MGGGGSDGFGLGRYRKGRRGHGYVADNDRHWDARTAGWAAKQRPTPECVGPAAGASGGPRTIPNCKKRWTLVEPATRGHPESPLRWTCKRHARLAEELRGRTIRSEIAPWPLLREAGYSLQANRKTREGGSHPDRNAQFEHINEHVLRFQKRQQPVISVDTKKKELVGDFKNGGREWRPRESPKKSAFTTFKTRAGQGDPLRRVRHCRTTKAGSAWASITTRPQFATNSIRRWWLRWGPPPFPAAKELLITADGGGSNSHAIATVEGLRCKTWPTISG